ncbi:MAG: bifunctional hydroxymethylpyrimidine kinase/phosphomethylpyrimidine kinase [Pseudomonadota bacterium]
MSGSKQNPDARVLIIAGSDSGGGAGVQGDIKTVTCLGGYAATAITALTAQNTLGVFGIHDVPEEFIIQQIKLVLDDIGADVLKTGMLSKESVIHAIADIISEYPHIPLVLDPVMFAKGGAALLEQKALATLKTHLIPRAEIITPNIPEAEYLSGITIKNVDDMRNAAKKILSLGCKSVLLKGGHLEGEIVTDLLLTADGETVFEQPRVGSKNTHGTGCALASAIATGIAQKMRLIDAVTRARKYVLEAIKTAPDIGNGHGPLNHGHTVKEYIIVN